MAEGSGLLNRRIPRGIPGVRIPPSPPFLSAKTRDAERKKEKSVFRGFLFCFLGECFCNASEYILGAKRARLSANVHGVSARRGQKGVNLGRFFHVFSLFQ